MTNGFERFCSISSNNTMAAFAAAVAKLTKNGLEDGFEIEDIIDYLSFMVESEAEVVKDVYDETYWSDNINQGLGLDNDPNFVDSAGFSIADRYDDDESSHHCDDPGCNCSI